MQYMVARLSSISKACSTCPKRPNGDMLFSKRRPHRRMVTIHEIQFDFKCEDYRCAALEETREVRGLRLPSPGKIYVGLRPGGP